MKKTLIITSKTTAKEINPLGEEPIDKFVDHDSNQFYNSEYNKWLQANSSLKEYNLKNIVGVYWRKDGPYLQESEGYKKLEIGNTYELEIRF